MPENAKGKTSRWLSADGMFIFSARQRNIIPTQQQNKATAAESPGYLQIAQQKIQNNTLFKKIYLFYLKIIITDVRKTGRKREREASHPLIHSPNDCNSQVTVTNRWVSKLGARIFFWIWLQAPKDLWYPPLLFQGIGRELNHKRDSWTWMKSLYRQRISLLVATPILKTIIL